MNNSQQSNCETVQPLTSSTSDYVNPNLSDIRDDDLEKIKGDAIGDTLYSARSVLRILINLNKIFSEEWTEELEQDLCLLWDMTLDKDVVIFLAKQNFIQLSTEIIQFTDNVRITEILVGIQGNMCCVAEVRQQFPAQSLDLLLSLFETRPDALTLLQVVRLLHSLSWELQSQTSGLWLDNETNISNLSARLAFVFASSTNDELLMSSLELVYTLCRLQAGDKDFTFYFATPEMVRGLLECWNQIIGSWSPDEDFQCKTHVKVADHWTAILSSFTSHHPGRVALRNSAEFIGDILTKLICREFQSDDSLLYPCVCILEALVKVYYSDRAMIKILEVFHSINSKEKPIENDSDSISVELMDRIESYCTNVALCVDRETLRDTLSKCNENYVMLFWKVVNERNPEGTLV